MPTPDTSSSPPAPYATRRRRRRHLLLSPFSAAARTSPSAASSSASSPASSGLSLFSFSRSPSPFHHRFFFSPLYASSAVPFAWEHRPGVPKTPARQSRVSRRSVAKAPPLPLPPSRLLFSSKVGANDDSFTIAADDDHFFIVSEGLKVRRRRSVRRQPALAAATLTDFLKVLSLGQSCKLSHDDCLAGTPPQRPRATGAKPVASWSGY